MRFLRLLTFVSAAVATPFSTYDLDNAQLPLSSSGELAQLLAQYSGSSGFDLDLNEVRLVQLEGTDHPVEMTELQKIQAKAMGVHFFDVTDTLELGLRAPYRIAKKSAFHDPNNTAVVRSAIDTLDVQNLRDNLATFTSFRTRYYLSQTGKQSQKWLIDKISEITKTFAPTDLQRDISIKEFPHKWAQSSIIARINGTSAEDDGVIVVSAHQDSTNKVPYLPAPGADDDGSGTMSILEAYRALLASGFRPERAVEFHWYAAEEGGLLGSQEVVLAYEKQDVNVIAIGQFDMTAWITRGTTEQAGIIADDYTNPELSEFTTKLADLYMDIPWVYTKCGFACSDHASWHKAGYAAASFIESTWEDNNHEHAHTVEDRYDISDEFSFDHMLEFSKLAVGFAVELGGWTKPA